MCTGTHPFIPVPNNARTRMVYTLLGQTIMNVFYFSQSSPFTTSDLTALNNSIVTEWHANVKGTQPSVMTLNFVESTALDTSSGAQVTTSVGVVGLNTSPPAPTGVTLAIKFATGHAGRSYRGRMYVCGITDSWIVGNTIDPSAAAAVLTAFATMFANVFTSTGAIHAIVSYCQAGAWLTTGVSTPVIDYVLVDNNIDSQRRRLAGRGI